jgi:hypothetical protein
MTRWRFAAAGIFRLHEVVVEARSEGVARYRARRALLEGTGETFRVELLRLLGTESEQQSRKPAPHMGDLHNSL